MRTLKKYSQTSHLSPEVSLLEKLGSENVRVLQKLFSEIIAFDDYPSKYIIGGKIDEGVFNRNDVSGQIEVTRISGDGNFVHLGIKKENGHEN